MAGIPDEIFGLPEPKDFANLMGSGLVFNATNLQEAFEEFDLDDEDSDEACESQGPTGRRKVESFETLRAKMKPADPSNLILKAIETEGRGEPPKDTSSVSILYSGYMKGESEPFTGKPSTKPTFVKLGDGSLLPGLETAIKSMVPGEKSQFLIDHSLMYGELGCPPLIPKKAECLFNVILLSVNNNNDSDERSADSWDFLCGKIYDNIQKGESLMKLKKHNDACKIFTTSLNRLDEFSLKDFTQEKEHTRLLCYIYEKLACCYTELKYPKKVCLMCNAYSQLSNLNKNASLLVLKAKAMIQLNELDLAESLLLTAARIEKDNKETNHQLKLLKRKREMLENHEKKISEFIPKNSTKKKEGVKNIEEVTDISDSLSPEFILEIQNTCESVLKDPTVTEYKFTLPEGLTDFEIEGIKLIILSYNLLVCETGDDFSYIHILKDKTVKS